ncbi:hypothetical protein CDAR_308871 [Caerostris darwini]|uniref:Uncharacterized protein n=1 Tax=Caerostris darwini TaxID=1538125 RepID=A0AAV4Q6Q8_9ARAC|nr:hypothetical protein CDAR_308871 [Caerostris darwini]
MIKRKYGSIIEDEKRIKVSKKKESSRDYRIIQQHDVLTAQGCKLIDHLSYAPGYLGYTSVQAQERLVQATLSLLPLIQGIAGNKDQDDEQHAQDDHQVVML